MAKPTPPPAHPNFVRHIKRPEWGVGRMMDVFNGLSRVQFSDGQTREFRADVLETVSEADAPEELRALQSSTPAPLVRPSAKRAKKK